MSKRDEILYGVIAGMETDIETHRDGISMLEFDKKTLVTKRKNLLWELSHLGYKNYCPKCGRKIIEFSSSLKREWIREA